MNGMVIEMKFILKFLKFKDDSLYKAYGKCLRAVVEMASQIFYF